MIKKLFDILQKNNLTLTSAESVTGGKFSSLIISEPGSSLFFKGGFICYSNEYKYNVLKVDKNIEIISFEMATQLSQNSRKIANADISISFTGNSSSNGIENKDKGLTYIGISNKNITNVIKFRSTKKKRNDIISDISIFGVNSILKFIRQNYK